MTQRVHVLQNCTYWDRTRHCQRERACYHISVGPAFYPPKTAQSLWKVKCLIRKINYVWIYFIYFCFRDDIKLRTLLIVSTNWQTFWKSAFSPSKTPSLWFFSGCINQLCNQDNNPNETNIIGYTFSPSYNKITSFFNKNKRITTISQQLFVIKRSSFLS